MRHAVVVMRVVLTVALAATSVAQTSRPTLGYVPDSGTIRPIFGDPADGIIGPALSAGGKYVQVVGSPTGSSFIAATGTGEVVAVTSADGVKVETVTIPGASAGNIQLSPNGTSALISKGNQLQVIGGLPGAAAVLWSADASQFNMGANIGAPGSASVLAVSDDGQWIAGVFGGSVYGLGAANKIVKLPAPTGVTALAFFHGKADLAVTTAAQIAKISEIGGAATLTILTGSANGPAPPESPMAIALTSDNAHVVVLEPSGGIGQLDIATGAVSTAKCECAAKGLFALGRFTFRISDLAGGSVKVYDAQLAKVAAFGLSSAEPTWRDKRFPEWTEADAKEVIANSPWVKQVTPTADPKTPEPDKPAKPPRAGASASGDGSSINLNGLASLPGVRRLGRKGNGSSSDKDQNGHAESGISSSDPRQSSSNSIPVLTLRWESALPVREAELKARETNAPAVDEDHYAIAVYGLPRAMIAKDSKEQTEELKKRTVLKREAKMDLHPSSVEILLRDDGPVILFLFPKSAGITWRDQHLQFDAQIGRLKLSQTFETGDMKFHGDLEL